MIYFMSIIIYKQDFLIMQMAARRLCMLWLPVRCQSSLHSSYIFLQVRCLSLCAYEDINDKKILTSKISDLYALIQHKLLSSPRGSRII